MAFGIKRCGTWHSPYWREDEANSHKKATSSNSEEYSGLDVALFKDILKDVLDVPGYEANEENILKEFGHDENEKAVPAECMKQIVSYYKFRKELFKKRYVEWCLTTELKPCSSGLEVMKPHPSASFQLNATTSAALSLATHVGKLELPLR